MLELLVAGDRSWRDLAHPATLSVFDRYGLAESTVTICSDPVVGSEGGLTATREYRSYTAVRGGLPARRRGPVPLPHRR